MWIKIGRIFIMNKKILLTILIILIIIGGVYFIWDSFSSNNALFGVSHFSDENISFDYPNTWVKMDSNDFYLTLMGLDRGLNLDVININDSSLDYQVEELINNNSSSNGGYKVFNVRKMMIEGHEAYDISSSFEEKGYFYRFLVFENNNYIYIFEVAGNDINQIENDFNLVKNSIKLKN